MATEPLKVVSVANWRKLKFYPIANDFPLLGEAELKDLADDIKRSGLLQPIVLYEGKILDGRNRFLACQLARVTPRFVRYEGTKPLQFVISYNLKRRHLSESQRAWIAVRLAVLSQGRPRAGSRDDGLTQREAASLMKVSRTLIQSAQRVLTHGTKELIKSVQEGHIKLDAAQRLIGLPEEVQDEIAQKARDVEPEEVPAMLQEVARQIREMDTQGRLSVKSHFSGRYAVILADPPWKSANKIPGSARGPFPTMSVQALCDLKVQGRPIKDLALTDAILFLWVPPAMLLAFQDVLSSWGFSYEAEMIWVRKKEGKLQEDNNPWVRSVAELLIVAQRGNFPPPAPSERPASVIEAPAEQSNTRPEQFYQIIEAAYPDVRRVELFSRSERKGWDVCNGPFDETGRPDTQY